CAARGPARGARARRKGGGWVLLRVGASPPGGAFRTGGWRRRVQGRYGRGGPGYITAGKPHIGVRSSSLKISVSSGWSYRSLQRPEAKPAEFWLAGYSAIASAAAESMSFASKRTLTFDTIEIEAIAHPRGRDI